MTALGMFGSFFIGILTVKELLSIRVRHLVTIHGCFKVDRQETFDLCFLHPVGFKALLRDHLFDPVGGIKYLFRLQISAAANEQELSGGSHFCLDIIQEINVLFADLPYLGIGFFLKPSLQIGFIIIEALAGVGTGNLDIRHGGQHHHQVMDLDLDIGPGQHGDIGGRNHIK